MFKDKWCEIQKEMIDNKLYRGTKATPAEEKSTPAVQKPLSELFKPASGTWECKMCYIRNSSDATVCVACKTANPSAPKPAAPATTTAPVGYDLMSKFKPAAGSWECQTCYIRNKGDVLQCVSCTTPKPGADVSKTADSALGGTGMYYTLILEPLKVIFFFLQLLQSLLESHLLVVHHSLLLVFLKIPAM